MTPHQEYTHRLAAQQEQFRKLSRADSVLSAIRGILFVLFVLLFFYVLNSDTSFLWISIPAIGFIIIMIYHERIIDQKNLSMRLAAFYERGLARLEDRWMGSGTQGERFKDAEHPYSEDLDLFGKGSIFELLCIARTYGGEQTLATWLLEPADPVTIRSRQGAVEELRNRLNFRVDIASRGSDVRNQIHPRVLIEWAQRPPVKFARGLHIATSLSVGLTLLTLFGWATLGWGWNPFVAVLLFQIFLMRHLVKRVQEITDGAEGAHQELKLLAVMLNRIEEENFQSPHLNDLIRKMRTEGAVPSRQIRSMGRLLELLDWQRNQLFAPVAILLLWQAHVAFALERWRNRFGHKIPLWFATVGEIESLNCFAGYAYENPGHPFPEIVEGTICYHGEELGHPLIPKQQCVRNNIRLDAENELKIVSGSNMSGKSTFLRTVGINAVFAFAGSTVPATRLKISPLTVGASIHILDSLQTGSSRFYAEITRLRQLMDLAEKKPPLLFLLDEILHGTNSADRLIGAEAIVHGFLQKNAIGLVTTHDLALTRIVQKIGSIAENIHFQDHIVDGRIAFDYRVHPGVVEKSNAIELMRAVGLEV